MTRGSHEGKRAIVTGGASRIGEATAKLLVSEGARVCIADIDADGAERVVGALRAEGGDVFAHVLDTSEPEQNDALVAATTGHFGGLDLVHLNAGIGIPSSIIDGDVEAWDRVIAVNLRGVFLGMRSSAPALIESGGGAIVVTSSVAGVLGGSNMPSYFASKHGLLGLTKAAATEFAPYGIRVNVICPGVVDTPILGVNHTETKDNRQVRSQMAMGHLLNRLAEVEEIAHLVSFLLGPHSGFITGSSHTIDGGLSCTLEPARPAR